MHGPYQISLRTPKTVQCTIGIARRMNQALPNGGVRFTLYMFLLNAWETEYRKVSLIDDRRQMDL